MHIPRATPIAAALALIAIAAGAQTPPAVRAVGPITHVSVTPLASASTAVLLSNGDVYVNDVVARRVLLFDSTLTKSIVVADTTRATANAYGGGLPGTLIAYRGDSVLFIEPASLSMLVLDANGKIARIMAIPRPDDYLFLFRTPNGLPAFDRDGRLVYYHGGASGAGSRAGNIGRQNTGMTPDTAFVVRVDLSTRRIDTLTSFKLPTGTKLIPTRDNSGNITSILFSTNPIPLYDGWAMCPDGAIAVVRGSDYHVDWLNPDGRWISTPPMPFAWQHVSDSLKTALIDSVTQAWQANFDSARRNDTARRAPSAPTEQIGRVDPSLVPDYRPPFTSAAIRADASSNIWIRTTTIVKNQPVYDVVNRRGELFDRVQLPPFRTIAGFGPGVVFMAVTDSAGVVHLERARVK